MSVALVQSRLTSYACASALEEEQALREITQEIALAALGRSDFYEKAAFHGGTSLRIFHGLNRFSEDLDFALIRTDASFLVYFTENLGELYPIIRRVGSARPLGGSAGTG